MKSSNMSSRPKIVQIIKPENLAHLNGLHKTIPSKSDSTQSGSFLEKVFSKPEGQNRITYFHCKQYAHRSFEYSKCINLIEGEGDEKDTPHDLKGKETREVGPVDGLEALMVLKKNTPIVEKKRL